ncbi:hypothetical protein K2X33_01580 [bacterium]|nr:hypothetical protein [bacterium]
MNHKQVGLLALAAFALVACGSERSGIPGPVLQGASSSGGDKVVGPPPFSFDCKLTYFDRTASPVDPKPLEFQLTHQNFRSARSTADYEVVFSPSWADYPASAMLMEVQLVVHATGGGLVRNASRSSAVFALDQKRFQAWIYNDQAEQGVASRRRALSLDCIKTPAP